jgi:molybdate transport system substrate-binding protein
MLELLVASSFSVLVASTALDAAEIVVLTTAGPLPGVLGAIPPMFEHASGHKVIISFQSATLIATQIKDGAKPDLLIRTDEVIDAVAKTTAIALGERASILLSRAGVAVRAGAPKPDIATAESSKAALLAAKSIAYSRGTSGRYFETVVERLGITDALKAKTIRMEGQPVEAVVAKGEAEIGMQQVAELLPVPGVDFVGPLPPELQTSIVYRAVIPAQANNAGPAKALVEFFSSEAASPIIKSKGMDPG